MVLGGLLVMPMLLSKLECSLWMSEWLSDRWRFIFIVAGRGGCELGI